jgi:hypothetical protein
MNKIKHSFFVAVLIVLSSFCSGYSADLFAIEALVQPVYEIEPKDNLADSGSGRYSIKRASFGFSSEQEILIPLKLNLSIDGAEAKILRNAWLRADFHSSFRVKAGRFKIPFSYDVQRSGDDFSFQSKGQISDYLQAELIEYRQNGVEFSGDIPFNLEYSLGIFDSPSFVLPGYEPFELVAGALTYKPFKGFELQASWMSDAIFLTQQSYYRTHAFDFSVLFKREGLRLESELFLPDSGAGNRIRALQSKENMKNSFRNFGEYLFKTSQFRTGPYLSLERVQRADRFVDYVGYGLVLRHKKRLGLNFNITNRYDELTEEFSVQKYALMLSLTTDILVSNETSVK